MRMGSPADYLDNLNQTWLKYIEGWDFSDGIDESLEKPAKQDLLSFSDLETVQVGQSQNNQVPSGLGTLDSSVLESGFIETQLPETQESTTHVEIAPWSAVGCFS